MSIRDNYQYEISKKLNYLANWMPNRPVRIGDTGVLFGRHFEPESNLSNSKPNFFGTRVSDNPFDISYYSEGAANIEFGASAGIALAGSQVSSKQFVKIKFEKAKSIFFEAKNCRIERLENFDSLRTELKYRFDAGEWDLNKVIVTEIIKIEVATIIITSKANAEVILRAHGDLNYMPSDNISANLSMAVEDRSSTELCLVGQSQVVPLFKVSKLEKRTFSEKLKWDSSLYSKDVDQYTFGELSPQNL